MRGYKEKREAWRLPRERYKFLREYCLTIADDTLIREAAAEATGDQLAVYIYRHVTSKDYTMPKMELDGLPCNRDTFNLYRAKFFWLLDKKVS